MSTVDGTLRGQPLRGQNGDFEKSFCGTLRGHRGTVRGQNGDFEKSFRGTLRGHRGILRGQNGDFPHSFCLLKVPSTVYYHFA